MKIVAPDFRNLLTTGNIVSACSAMFICGMAWMNVQGTQASQAEKILKIEKKEDTLTDNVQDIKLDVATIKVIQANQSKTLEEVKDWLKTISARQNR